MTGKIVTRTRSTSPAAISAQFRVRRPWERIGASDSALRRATTSAASAHSRTVTSGQSSGLVSVDEITVVGRYFIRVLIGSSASESSVIPLGIVANSRIVPGPRTSRLASSIAATRLATGSGPCLPQ